MKGLPSDLPTPERIASDLALFLKEERYFEGSVWLYETLENYILEQLLIENDGIILDDLSGVMSETNACFDEPYYETADKYDVKNGIAIIVDGTYSGLSHDDMMFCGDKIDMRVVVILYRASGRRGFHSYDIIVGGEINDDWVDPELKYGTNDETVSNALAEKIARAQKDYQQRRKDIHTINGKISSGQAVVEEIEELSSLLVQCGS